MKKQRMKILNDRLMSIKVDREEHPDKENAAKARPFYRKTFGLDLAEDLQKLNKTSVEVYGAVNTLFLQSCG